MTSFFSLFFCAAALIAAPPSQIKDGQLIVDGKPFLVFGAQVHNSSAWAGRLEKIWPQIEALHANTIEAPVYWEAVESEPGRFDFENVDAVILGARERHLRVILLWFGTWKNGAMDYVPAWVKRDDKRFPRVRNSAGKPINSLSPHAPGTLAADSRAFAALMTHVREFDEAHGTVILVQVENEPGSLGSDRDYSPAAEKLFSSAVPAALGRKTGNWTEVFGESAAETFQAWNVASYINAVAAAGKKVYALPMYVNVWLREGGFERPGETYPSGGATWNVIPIWKAAAPSIDLLAPDIYLPGTEASREVCRQYKRPDNPLLIPESGGSLVFARYLFRALGDFSAIGFAPFGFDREGTGLDPRLEAMASSFRLLRPAIPLITAAQATGTLRAAIEDELVTERLLHLKLVDALVSFRGRDGLEVASAPNALERQGRLLIIEERPAVVWLIGFQARVQFRGASFLAVEEGTFENGAWKRTRLRNGDEIFGGVSLDGGGAILRVSLLQN